MIPVNAVTISCYYTYVNIKKCTYRLFGKGIRKCFKQDAVESKKTCLETPHLPKEQDSFYQAPKSTPNFIRPLKHILGCTIIITVNSKFYFLAHLRQPQCIFKFQNLIESMPSSKVPRDKAKIDMLTVFKFLSVARN